MAAKLKDYEVVFTVGDGSVNINTTLKAASFDDAYSKANDMEIEDLFTAKAGVTVDDFFFDLEIVSISEV